MGGDGQDYGQSMPYHPLPHARPHHHHHHFIIIIIVAAIAIAIPPLTLSHPLSPSHAYTRVLPAFLPLPPCILSSISSSSSRYLAVTFKIYFIASSLSFSRSRSITHNILSLSRSSLLLSLPRAHAFALSCPTKKIVSLTHNSLLLFIIIISLSYI